jgi:outer membrane lipoprotein-sorting protein
MARLKTFALLLALLAAALPAVGQEKAPAQIVREALGKLDGFDATYKAESTCGKAYTIRARFLAPNKMRYDLEELGVMTLFDGDRYLYYDQKQERALIMKAARVQAELQQQFEAFEKISWFGGGVGARAGGDIYPNFILGFSPEHLDIALEMSTQSHTHSWVQGLANGENVVRDGNAYTFDQAGSGGLIRLRVGADSGVLLKAEMGDAGAAVGTIDLTDFSREAPPSAVFDFVVPSSVETRDNDGDPTLLQQLLVTSLRSSLDAVLEKARKDWTTFSQAQKQELREAVKAGFEQIFQLGEKQTNARVASSMEQGDFPTQVRAAMANEDNKSRFAKDHPELSGAALDDGWRTQVIQESSRAVLFDILRTVDTQFAAPIREQAFSLSAGLSETDREQLVRTVTDPIYEVFTNMTKPAVEKTLRDITGG